MLVILQVQMGATPKLKVRKGNRKECINPWRQGHLWRDDKVLKLAICAWKSYTLNSFTAGWWDDRLTMISVTLKCQDV